MILFWNQAIHYQFLKVFEVFNRDPYYLSVFSKGEYVLVQKMMSILNLGDYPPSVRCIQNSPSVIF